MSNNSIGFIEKPDKEIFDLFRDMLVLEGEPGFINLYEATERLLAAQGITTATHGEKVEMAKEVGLNPLNASGCKTPLSAGKSYVTISSQA